MGRGKKPLEQEDSLYEQVDGGVAGVHSHKRIRLSLSRWLSLRARYGRTIPISHCRAPLSPRSTLSGLAANAGISSTPSASSPLQLDAERRVRAPSVRD